MWCIFQIDNFTADEEQIDVSEYIPSMVDQRIGAAAFSSIFETAAAAAAQIEFSYMNTGNIDDSHCFLRDRMLQVDDSSESGSETAGEQMAASRRWKQIVLGLSDPSAAIETLSSGYSSDSETGIEENASDRPELSKLDVALLALSEMQSFGGPIRISPTELIRAMNTADSTEEGTRFFTETRYFSDNDSES